MFILERLTESLRMSHVPVVQAQIFLCFRVLLIRMSPHHVTSLWPVIITEMVCIFNFFNGLSAYFYKLTLINFF